MVETGTVFWLGNAGWKLAWMGGYPGRTWVEKSDGQWPPLVRVEVSPDFPEIAIGCLRPVGTSNDPETSQSLLRPLSCRGARLNPPPCDFIARVTD
jgi:hypothetical protein